MRKNVFVRLLSVTAVFVMLACLLTVSTGVYGIEGLKDKEWVESYEEYELYPGVMAYNLVSSASSTYKLNRIHIVEFDPAQSDLYVEVTNEAQYSNTLKSVQKTMEDYNANHPGYTALAGVNGDMWMVSYAHARILGREDLLTGSYKSYAKDPVVTQSLTIPRGFNVYKGEIISTPHNSAETPYEGEFTSFGISADGQAQLGKPSVTIVVTNNTKGTTVKPNGINRLPSNKAIMMYTDKGPVSNYSLEDAYEIVIDFNEDYVIKHGTNITGTVVGICGPGDENMPMQENRIIITARGEKKIASVSDYEIGDSVTIDISVKDGFKNTEFWQNVYTAVGGHMEFARDGKYNGLSGEGGYPTTIIATTKSGKMLLIEADGRQSDYSVGIPFGSYLQLARDLELEDAFIVDGGGSATMVQLAEAGYKLVNRPSDKKSDGTYGSPRSVVNSVIVAAGPDRNAPPATEEPTAEPTAEPVAEPTEAVAPATGNGGTSDKDRSGSGLDTGAIIAIAVGAAAIIGIVVATILILKRKKA